MAKKEFDPEVDILGAKQDPNKLQRETYLADAGSVLEVLLQAEIDSLTDGLTLPTATESGVLVNFEYEGKERTVNIADYGVISTTDEGSGQTHQVLLLKAHALSNNESSLRTLTFFAVRSLLEGLINQGKVADRENISVAIQFSDEDQGVAEQLPGQVKTKIDGKATFINAPDHVVLNHNSGEVNLMFCL